MGTYYQELKDKGQFNEFSTQPTLALRNMIKALSTMKGLNTQEENDRLEGAKRELKRRGKKGA